MNEPLIYLKSYKEPLKDDILIMSRSLGKQYAQASECLAPYSGSFENVSLQWKIIREVSITSHPSFIQYTGRVTRPTLKYRKGWVEGVQKLINK